MNPRRYRPTNPFGRSPIAPSSFQRSVSMNSIIPSCEHDKLTRITDNLYECEKCKKTFDVNVPQVFQNVPPVFQDTSFVQKSMWEDLEHMRSPIQIGKYLDSKPTPLIPGINASYLHEPHKLPKPLIPSRIDTSYLKSTGGSPSIGGFRKEGWI
jgi:hypothetical protein